LSLKPQTSALKGRKEKSWDLGDLVLAIISPAFHGVFEMHTLRAAKGFSIYRGDFNCS
jgi:hypothetical protein